jgi:hypothetical protein
MNEEIDLDIEDPHNQEQSTYSKIEQSAEKRRSQKKSLFSQNN